MSAKLKILMHSFYSVLKPSEIAHCYGLIRQQTLLNAGYEVIKNTTLDTCRYRLKTLALETYKKINSRIRSSERFVTINPVYSNNSDALALIPG